MSYTPLSVISENSLLRSTVTVDDLIDFAKVKQLDILALTDNNVMYAAVPFYQKCLENGIKPIIGLNVSLTSTVENETLPLTLYAKDQIGYQALIQLSTLVSMATSQTLTLEQVEERADHLIVIIRPFTQAGELITKASIDFQTLGKVFPSVYLGIDITQLINVEMEDYRKLSQRYQLPLLAFQTVNRLYEEDDVTVKVLRAIDEKKTLEDMENASQAVSSRYHAFETVLQSVQLYQESGFADALEATKLVSEQVNLTIPLEQKLLPTYPLAQGEDSTVYLKKLAFQGAKERLSTVNDQYVERLNKELAVIDEMGFSDYFLIVWDIVSYAKKHHIQTGPGRGSAAGSLVAYCLYIIDVDPLAYDLLFERFLNRERFSPPDIDLDVPDNKRSQLITYIQSKYGAEHVAQIITFGTLGAKQSIRDTARIMGKTPQEINALSKAIPTEADMTLAKAYQDSANFKKLIDSSSKNQQILKSAQRIEGLKRNVSTHASGVVISSVPLMQLVPLQDTQGNLPIIQYEMSILEDVGLLKFDILGSKNLAILSDALASIRQESPTFNIEEIPLDDRQTLKIFEAVDTNGIFQFESNGMQRFLKQLRPTSFEDVIAAIALFRPGPMKEISHFIKRRQGSEAVEFVHKDLTSLLRPTYGIMIYQEQVMRAAQIVAHYSLGEADILRRAIGHKDRELIAKEKQHFVEAAVANGYSRQDSLDIYHYIERFADYGFNKSHAVAYSLLSFQQAYIKAHYPKAFYAAIMRHAGAVKLKMYAIEARYKGISFLAPDINKSRYSYAVETNGIRLGFAQIKHLQVATIKNTVKLQSHQYFEDFIAYVKALDVQSINEKSLQALIYSGAFDYSGYNRKTLIVSLENILKNVKTAHLSENLFSLFQPHYIKSEDFSDLEKAEKELEYLSVSLTSHPINAYSDVRHYHQFRYLIEIRDQSRFNILATLNSYKAFQTKKGEVMAELTLSDETANLTAVAFPETYRRYIKLIEKGNNLAVSLKKSHRKGEVQYIVEQIYSADRLKNDLPRGSLFIRLYDKISAQQQASLDAVSREYAGKTPVFIYDDSTGKTYRLKSHFWMHYSDELQNVLEQAFGSGNVVYQENGNND